MTSRRTALLTNFGRTIRTRPQREQRRKRLGGRTKWHALRHKGHGRRHEDDGIAGSSVKKIATSDFAQALIAISRAVRESVRMSSIFIIAERKAELNETDRFRRAATNKGGDYRLGKKKDFCRLASRFSEGSLRI